MISIPNKPECLVKANTEDFMKSFEKIKHEMEIESSQKTKSFELQAKLQASVNYSDLCYVSGNIEEGCKSLEDSRELCKVFVKELEGSPLWLRNNYVADVIGSHIQVECFNEFITTGELYGRNSLCVEITNDEYIIGVISFCQSLSRYAVGRGTVGDSASIDACLEMVEQIHEKLLEFDFRNGPLRRKFDGVKYTVKRLQDLIYELSLTEDVKEPAQKRAKMASPASRITNAGFDKMISEISAFDEAREQVIKQCRDVQKLSKQSIYSLHRGDMEKASFQLSTACKKAISIRDEFLKSMPKLRSGSFANAMEEYAEAKLYEHWLLHGDILFADSETFADLVTSEEYLGGLVDFTGEIGRFAVHQATSRNVDKVKSALGSDLAVQAAVMHLASTPGRLQKKLGALSMNVRKLESLLYDLALTQMTGRKTAERSSLEDAPKAVNSSKDGDDA